MKIGNNLATDWRCNQNLSVYNFWQLLDYFKNKDLYEITFGKFDAKDSVYIYTNGRYDNMRSSLYLGQYENR